MKGLIVSYFMFIFIVMCAAAIAALVLLWIGMVVYDKHVARKYAKKDLVTELPKLGSSDLFDKVEEYRHDFS